MYEILRAPSVEALLAEAGKAAHASEHEPDTHNHETVGGGSELSSKEEPLPSPSKRGELVFVSATGTAETHGIELHEEEKAGSGSSLLRVSDDPVLQAGECALFCDYPL